VEPLVDVSEVGLWCPAGGFHVDAWGPSALTIVTHAHGDHARMGSGRYVCSPETATLLRHRFGPDAPIEVMAWGEPRRFGATTVSLHPAGHILGSAQVRIVREGETWVLSGDYKRAADSSCAAFEPLTCDVFVTEATFALPIYRWAEPGSLVRELRDWWLECRAAGRPALLFCYALGKAQRILSALGELAREEGREPDPVHVHGAVEAMVGRYREAGVDLPPTRRVLETEDPGEIERALVLAPPSAFRSPWMRRLPGAETAFASGWTTVRAIRKRRGVDRGFAISDHADWPALLDTIAATGARRVLTTHGYADVLARYLSERGLEAAALRTPYAGEEGEEET
jgi:putative mRNA 3-end processing factor